MKYADNIDKLTNNLTSTESFIHHIPEVLESRDLVINQHKTEHYLINGTTHEWRKCKYLGRMLDTNEDIKLRKVFAGNSFVQIFIPKQLYATCFILSI